jgi:cysteine desulfurase / selenocysteine lyase
VLAGTPESLGSLRPVLIGGETVEWSTLTEHRLRPSPYRFEAGLQNYAGAIGARAGIDFLSRVGFEEVQRRQRAVNDRVSGAFEDEPRLHLLGPKDPARRSSIFAFTLDGVDPHDAALFLDEGYGVMVRSGMHCVHSFYANRGIPGNVRASFYLYNDRSDADALVRGLRELLEKLGERGVSGTSAGRATTPSRRASGRPRAAGSRGAAVRSAPPRRRAEPGRAASAKGSD